MKTKMASATAISSRKIQKPCIGGRYTCPVAGELNWRE